MENVFFVTWQAGESESLNYFIATFSQPIPRILLICIFLYFVGIFWQKGIRFEDMTTEVKNTVGSKIIRAFGIVRIKILIPKAVFWNKYLSVMIFRLYTVFNKHEMIKISNQIREKSQVLSQVLEQFCCRLYLFSELPRLSPLKFTEVNGLIKNIKVLSLYLNKNMCTYNNLSTKIFKIREGFCFML